MEKRLLLHCRLEPVIKTFATIKNPPKTKEDRNLLIALTQNYTPRFKAISTCLNSWFKRFFSFAVKGRLP